MNFRNISSEFKKSPGEWLLCGFFGVMLAIQLATIESHPDPKEPAVLLEYSLIGRVVLGDDVVVGNELIVRSLKCTNGNLEFNEASAQGENKGMVKNSSICEGDEFRPQSLEASWTASSPS